MNPNNKYFKTHISTNTNTRSRIFNNKNEKKIPILKYNESMRTF